MNNIIGNMIKGNKDIDDKLIVMSLLSSAKESADMYLNATLTSTTPELRLLYSTPIEQLTCAFNEYKKVIKQKYELSLIYFLLGSQITLNAFHNLVKNIISTPLTVMDMEKVLKILINIVLIS